jgi:hypothetical protein
MLKLFEVKSTVNKEKSVYYVILKSLLLRNFPTVDLNAWRHLQLQIFSKDELAVLRGLVEPIRLVASINEI